jgi:hypothetical protein
VYSLEIFYVVPDVANKRIKFTTTTPLVHVSPNSN